MLDAQHSTIQTHNLSVGYASAILPPLSLSLRQGQMTVLLGANGVGKSSFLRTLAGLQPPLAGKAEVAGKDISSCSPVELAQKISLVLTDKPQDLYITVRDTLALARFPYLRWYQRLQASDWAIVSEMLQLTQTEHLADKRLATLSDGQLQKVMIARALVQDTPVILLDEPTAHLDLPNRFMIFQLLRDLAHKTQKAILVATHDLEPCLQTADVVWLLHKGACFVGLPETLALEGKIAEAFGSDFLEYDLAQDKFRLKTPLLAYVRLAGEGIAYAQTQKALARIGVGVSETAETQITVLPTESGYAWEWAGKGRFEDLGMLLKEFLL